MKLVYFLFNVFYIQHFDAKWNPISTTLESQTPSIVVDQPFSNSNVSEVIDPEFIEGLSFERK